jgi:pilus assembly protein Flp/PilA
MHRLFELLRQDETGAALVEYGMLASLIAVICVTAVTALGTQISSAFSYYVVNMAAI